jgi:hypothetical protein
LEVGIVSDFRASRAAMDACVTAPGHSVRALRDPNHVSLRMGVYRDKSARTGFSGSQLVLDERIGLFSSTEN